jgi:hypothetical protein
MISQPYSNDDEVTKIVKGLKWEDKFFDQEEGLVAVFDYDYESVTSFHTKVVCAQMLFPFTCIFGSLCLYPCFCKQQIKWDTHSKHVAVTIDGIKHVHDKRKQGCGCFCQDAGKTSKTVPFDKITDCDVTEPAGATCCCVTNILSKVFVDTASGARTGSGGEGGGLPAHELELVGLHKPHEFKKLVWAMKRRTAGGGSAAQAVTISRPPQAATMERDDNGETNAILRDIRSELVKMNKNIQK